MITCIYFSNKDDEQLKKMVTRGRESVVDFVAFGKDYTVQDLQKHSEEWHRLPTLCVLEANFLSSSSPQFDWKDLQIHTNWEYIFFCSTENIYLNLPKYSNVHYMNRGGAIVRQAGLSIARLRKLMDKTESVTSPLLSDPNESSASSAAAPGPQ